MFFITPSKPGIFLIGIYRNRLYGFGENKSKKLCIYSKLIFDCDDWEELSVVDINVMKAECCETGIHVAAGIYKTKIWIAARDKELTRIFSIDIVTNQFIAYKMLEEIYEGTALPGRNLCCKCSMPVIRHFGYDLNLHMFIITPRRYQKDVGIFRLAFFINISYHCLLSNSLTRFPLIPSPLSSNIAVNCEGEALFVSEKTEDGKIKTLSLGRRGHHVIFPISLDDAIHSTWHDATFFHDNFNAMYCLTRGRSGENNVIFLHLINFSVENLSAIMRPVFFLTVAADFPSFESSPFFLGYNIIGVKRLSSRRSTITVKPDFIIFQTADSIVTVPLRMLTLAETAYLTLRQLPEPSPLPVAEVKFSIFKWIKWLFSFFFRKPNQATHSWMSLNHISKALGLSNTFHLL